MKRALGVIVFAALKAGNVAFHNVRKITFIPIRHGKLFKFAKFVKSIVAFFLRHIGCGANALIFGVEPLEKVALLNRIVSTFQHCTLHSCENFSQVKHLETEGYYA